MSSYRHWKNLSGTFNVAGPGVHLRGVPTEILVESIIANCNSAFRAGEKSQAIRQKKEQGIPLTMVEEIVLMEVPIK